MAENIFTGVIVMEFIELVKRFMSMPAGWVVLVIISIILAILLYAVLTASKRADELMEGHRCKREKRAMKKQRYTPASLVTSALSASGIMASSRSSKTEEHSMLATPADMVKSRHLENVRFKKMRQVRKQRRKTDEHRDTA